MTDLSSYAISTTPSLRFMVCTDAGSAACVLNDENVREVCPELNYYNNIMASMVMKIKTILKGD